MSRKRGEGTHVPRAGEGTVFHARGRGIRGCTYVERGGDLTPLAVGKGMVFDLICRGCGACAQRVWDPTDVVSATNCPDCDAAMSVIGIDFPAGHEAIGLTSLLEVIQGAGIIPVAVERRARGGLQAEAA